jgi:hypothetical protein
VGGGGGGGGRGAHAPTALDHLENPFAVDDIRESGSLVAVHSAELLEVPGKVVLPSLSNSVRVNTDNPAAPLFANGWAVGRMPVEIIVRRDRNGDCGPE